jgi:hypothetical protein
MPISEMGHKQLQLAVFRSPPEPAAQRQRHGDAERPGRLEGKVISERTAKQRLGTSGRCALQGSESAHTWCPDGPTVSLSVVIGVSRIRCAHPLQIAARRRAWRGILAVEVGRRFG